MLATLIRAFGEFSCPYARFTPVIQAPAPIAVVC
jgi:hypothetical protein